MSVNRPFAIESCEEMTKQLKAALGTVDKTTHTAEFYAADVQQERLRVGGAS